MWREKFFPWNLKEILRELKRFNLMTRSNVTERKTVAIPQTVATISISLFGTLFLDERHKERTTRVGPILIDISPTMAAHCLLHFHYWNLCVSPVWYETSFSPGCASASQVDDPICQVISERVYLRRRNLNCSATGTICLVERTMRQKCIL